MHRIFVQIASYRDVELPLTIKSALESATYPERVTFGICWQYDELTYLDIDEFIHGSRFRISQTYYENSKGCCWARNQTNLLYDNEKYTLQIDAHTRFAANWDVRFIDSLESLQSEKPVLSTYPAPFEYIDGVEHRFTDRGMQRLIMNRMLPNLTTIYKSEVIEDRSKPVPSQFIAAGQIFTYGKFCQEVEYDPELYYAGEEINLAARAYTHGYDFFCPNEDLLWHYYQHSMPQHGADHHHTQHDTAVSRLHTLFIGDHTQLGKYGLGLTRSLSEFEEFAEISFQGRLDRKRVKCNFKKSIELDLSCIDLRDDYDFWIFTLQNVDDEEIYRKDLYNQDIPTSESRNLEIDEELEDEPFRYMLWPHTREEGYLSQHFHEFR